MHRLGCVSFNVYYIYTVQIETSTSQLGGFPILQNQRNGRWVQKSESSMAPISSMFKMLYESPRLRGTPVRP
jgi:hypothetical protein